MYEKIYKEAIEYFDNLIKNNGTNNKGVGWNSRESQFIRYEQTSKVIEFDGMKDITICDYGCGYGGYYEYLLSEVKDKLNLKYIGLDISEKMINSAKTIYGDNNEKHTFMRITGADEIVESDYIISSGIFNLKNNINYKEWTDYIIYNLEKMNANSKKGFSFNCLTKYSDKELMRDELYYGDPLFFFDYCKTNFSRNVALLHDYNLYEFTILVKKL